MVLKVTQCQAICKKDHYTVVNGSLEYCLKCATCHHGRGLYPPCGSRIPYPPNPDCRDCPAGEFSDELDSAACHSCQKCAEHENVTAPCTSESNTICNGTCEAGYFYSEKDSTHSCKKCSYCCLDGRDEEIPECAKQGLKASKQHCHPRPDKDCSPGSPSASPADHLGGTEAPANGGLSSFTIAGIVVGVAGGVVIALATGICLYRTRKKKRPTRSGTCTVERQEISGAISANEQANQNATLISLPSRNNLSEPDSGFVNLGAAKDNTSDRKARGDPTALPVITEDASPAFKEPAVEDEAATSGGPLGKLSGQFSKDSQRNGDADAKSGKRRRLSPPVSSFTEPLKTLRRMSIKRGDSLVDNEEQDTDGSQGDADAKSGKRRRLSPSVSSFTEPLKTLRRMSIKRGDSLVDNEEQDTDGSQGDADAKSGKRRRLSPSVSGFTEPLKTLRRVSIKGGDSLVDNEEQDTDESQNAIAIRKQPSSQEIKEGSKVELVFKCKPPGNSKLSYQWSKDDTKLQGEDEGTLVLKYVTLYDFGYYKCVASLKDSPSVSVESSLAELDVTPRDGTMYKCLRDIDFDTENQIGILLTQTSSVVAGWKQIASKYGMDKLKIKFLENDPEPGKRMLEYLVSSVNPNLTVYDFCKTLKGHNIRRLDIVDALRGHLSVSSSSKVYV